MEELAHKRIYLFDWGNTLMRDFPEIKTPMYTWDKVESMPNAQITLATISQKADCYLATNAIVSTKEEIKKALKRGGLSPYIKNIFCYQEFGVKKPDAAYFKLIMSQLQVPKKEVVMIGDNLNGDVLGAKQFGIDAILYDPQHGHPDYRGSKIYDLKQLIQRH